MRLFARERPGFGCRTVLGDLEGFLSSILLQPSHADMAHTWHVRLLVLLVLCTFSHSRTRLAFWNIQNNEHSESQVRLTL